LLLWLLFVAYCAIGMADFTLAYAILPVGGRATYFQALLAGAVVLGSGILLRGAGGSVRNFGRMTCRIILAYLLFEALIVIPVGAWLGVTSLNEIFGSIGVRATWMLFPVMLAVCADVQAQRIAGVAPVIAAVALAGWGVYLAVTGAGGLYVELGEMRYRILYGAATLLFAWPFVLAVSDAAPRRYTLALLAVAGLGLGLAGHRSGLIAFAVGGAVCLGLSGQIRRLLPAAVPIALVVGIVALVWGDRLGTAFGYTVTNLFNFSSGNGADRLMRWRLAWDAFLTRPFNDWVWSWRYYLVYLQDAYQPHNFVLEVALTEGVVGLVFYGTMLWTALHGAWVWVRRDAVARALVGWLIVYVVFSLANANHYIPVSMPLLVGALAALVSRVDWLRHSERHGPVGNASPGAHT
jgi:hypothetical protein